MCSLTSLALGAVALVVALPAAPSPVWARCQGVVKGPCASPEPAGFLPGLPDLVVTNFGLLYPGAAPSEWQVVCDDSFGLAPASRLRRAPDGRVFAPSEVGLYRSADGCDWTVAGGQLDGRVVFDVAFAGGAGGDAGIPGGRVWALADVPRSLYRSDDGGDSFTRVASFSESQPFTRLAVSPDGQRLYLFGRGGGGTTPAALSLDGGQTFTGFDLSARASSAPATPLDFVAMDPHDPQVLYFTVPHPQGDQLWISRDGAQTVAPLLKLQSADALAGLAFGDSATAGSRTLYVAGTDLFPAAGGSFTGRLYVSRDDGSTWQAPIVSSPRGPRYRCLAWSAGRLYACGLGEALGDEFMVGVSSDEGRTWQPYARLTDISGARACVKARCLRTEVWLCNSYGQCAPGLSPADAGGDVAVDTGTRDAGGCVGTACVEQQGCSCDLAGRRARPPGGAWPLVLVALFTSWTATRRRSGFPRPTAPCIRRTAPGCASGCRTAPSCPCPSRSAPARPCTGSSRPPGSTPP